MVRLSESLVCVGSFLEEHNAISMVGNYASRYCADAVGFRNRTFYVLPSQQRYTHRGDLG